MARNILIVNATQVVVSENHPEGLFSVISGFPKNFDSVNYGDDIALAMRQAKAAYFDQLSKNYANTNEARAMTTVTLTAADGMPIMHECVGKFPVVNPEPEEPEEPAEPEPNQGE